MSKGRTFVLSLLIAGVLLLLLGWGLNNLAVMLFGGFLVVLGIMIWISLPVLSDIYEHGWPSDSYEVVKYPSDDDSDEEEESLDE